MIRDLLFFAVVISLCLLGATSCFPTSDKVESIKVAAPKVIAEQGMEMVSYQGYQYKSLISGCPGGAAWYTATRDGTLYEFAICEWAGEHHIYNLAAKNAIKGD